MGWHTMQCDVYVIVDSSTVPTRHDMLRTAGLLQKQYSQLWTPVLGPTNVMHPTDSRVCWPARAAPARGILVCFDCDLLLGGTELHQW